MRLAPVLGILASAAVVAAAVPAHAANRSGEVSISSSGVTAVDVYTYQDSTDNFATFTVTDRSAVGAIISQCWEDADGSPFDCDTYLLEEDNFGDGDWRIRRTADGWQIRVYVAYYPFSTDQCWDLATGEEYGINIAVMGEDDEVLADRSHSYTLTCRGYAGGAKGAKSLRVSVGGSSDPLPIAFSVLDSRHEAKSARGCLYSFTTERLTNCSAIDLTGSSVRTATGWSYNARLVLPAVSARQCKGIKRQEPRMAYQIVFKDRSGDELVTVSHAFTLTCR